MQKLLNIIAAIALGALLTSCGTDTSSGDGNPNGGPSTPVSTSSSGGSGNLAGFSLRLTDAPIDDMTEVVIRVLEIELKRTAGGWLKYTLATPVTIDLLSAQGTSTAELLNNVQADSEEYKEVRLIVDGTPMANYVRLVSDGSMHNLDIPSGSTSGIKVKDNFSVSNSGETTIVIDFDLRQSLRQNGGPNNYSLDPVTRMVDIDNAGHIRGTVHPPLLTAPSCSDGDVDTYNAAYIWAGHNAPLEDIDDDGDGENPVATTAIAYNPNAGYLYEAAYLPPRRLHHCIDL